MDLRKLDALVAEHVICLTDPKQECPYYSTNIAAAWEVVNKLGFDKWRWTGEMGTINGIECYHWLFRVGDQHFGANAKSTSLAICLAALQSKNIDVREWDPFFFWSK